MRVKDNGVGHIPIVHSQETFQVHSIMCFSVMEVSVILSYGDRRYSSPDLPISDTKK